MQTNTAIRPLENEGRRNVSLTFSDNRLVADLIGEFDRNLVYIEKQMGVGLSSRGNTIFVAGPELCSQETEILLRDLYQKAQCGEEITNGLIDAEMRKLREPQFREVLSHDDSNVIPQVAIKTRRKTIAPRTPAQAGYIMAMQREEMIFALGPAGTGKTYLAVAQAVACLTQGIVSKLILSRPAVEAGERLGFLPGDMKEMVDPCLRPIYDALHDCLPPEQVERRIASGEIEVAPLAFMRGRTLAGAFIILDEAQNATPAQMKMFLTRFGEASRMVICGDPNQSDLPGGANASGLTDAVQRLSSVEGIHMAHFKSTDVVRHPLVGKIVDAYEG